MGTDSSGIERDHVKAISAGRIYADCTLGLDSGAGSAASRRALASPRAKDATEYGTSNYKHSDRDTELDPVTNRLLWRPSR